MLDDLYIRDGKVDDLSYIYTLMLEDFPPEELKSREQILKLMVRDEYRMYLLKGDDGILGYAFAVNLRELGILWLDYIAVKSCRRGCGFGAVFMNLLKKSCDDMRCIVVEVEPPDSTIEEVLADQKRRIAFYKRLGGEKLDIHYRLPTKDGSIPLDLYYISCDGSKTPCKNTLMAAVEKILSTVHDDYDHSEHVIEEIRKNI